MRGLYMSNVHSGYLKTITGVLLISKDGDDMLCCIEDLQNTKHFTIGQIFNAIRVLNGKSVKDYGSLWPKYRVGYESTISKDWEALTSAYNNCESDYEFLIAACEQLQEEVPEIVERKKVEKQIELFKQTITNLTASQ
jgi:hypothetical protein